MSENHQKFNMQRTKPTKQSFFDNLYRISEKESTVEHARISLVHFERFCEKIYQKEQDQVVEELKIESKKDPEIIIDFLEDLIHYLIDIKKIDHRTGERTGDRIAVITVKGYFASIKRYLRHYRIVINNEDIKDFVKLPKTRKEIEDRLELEDIQKLVDNAHPLRSTFYKLLATSGMRFGEALQLKKNHFDLNCNPVRIHIPSNIAKNNHARIVFTTKEVMVGLKEILPELEHDDLVFARSETLSRAKLTEETYFARLRVKCKIAEYEPSGKKHRVRIHKLRKWFNSTITNAGMKTEHRQTITGWDSFEGTYHEYSAQELGDEYLKIENHLLIDAEWRLKYEIKQKDQELRKENEKLTSSLDDLKFRLIKLENEKDEVVEEKEIVSKEKIEVSNQNEVLETLMKLQMGTLDKDVSFTLTKDGKMTMELKKKK